MNIPPSLSRLALLIGDENVSKLQSLRIAFFGLGGVGSWAAESLVRSGVGAITLVDSDAVCITNINRQLPATLPTVGQSKVQVLAKRFQEINPTLQVEAIQSMYAVGDGEKFQLERFDYVIDAIDSLDSKVDLILAAQSAGCLVFSSMGAGNKLDPSQIRIGDIWKTHTDPMAKAVRTKLRARGFSGSLPCVYSLEKPIPPREAPRPPEATATPRRITNASVAHITVTFGQFLASMVIQDLLNPNP